VRPKSATKPYSIAAHLIYRLSRFAERGAPVVLLALLLAMSSSCGSTVTASIPVPKILSFAAYPSTITSGSNTNLTWSVSGATALTITDSNGTAVTGANSVVVSSTSVAVSPAATVSYTLTATSAAGSVTAMTSVTVVPVPVISSFTATPPLISSGQSSTLNWNATGVSNLTITPTVGIVTGLTSVVVSPATTTTYIMTGSNTAELQTTATATVTVVAPPTVLSFTAMPSTISSGQTSTLSWNVVGATSVSIDNGIGTVAASGTIAVSPAATTMYNLTATNTVGSLAPVSTAQATVTFSNSFIPTVTSFSASPPSVGPGGSSTLTPIFDAGPGGTAAVDQGVGAVTSGDPVSTGSLSSSTTFTLSVTNGTETVTALERVLAGSLAVFAGIPTTPGSADGPGSVATFNTPRGVAVDITGNVYVADTDNNTIRKITPAGVVSTLAGTAGVPPGSLDGSGAAAQFYSPTGVAVDTQGNVYVADSGNNTIRMITPSGGVTTLAGTAGQVGSLDGTGPAAQFNSPSGVAVDTQGNVYVTDSSNNTIRKIAPGGVVTTLAGTALVVGSLDGAGAAASFQFPNGIAVDTSGTVYVADTNNNTIRVITPAGVVSTLAGTAGVGRGSVDGTGADARFGGPLSLALDSLHGYVYVADTGNFTVRRISPAGVVTTVVGQAGQVNTIPSGPLPGQITTDNGIAVDPVSGNMYISLNDDAIITAPF